MKGRVYSRRTVRATRAPGAAASRMLMGVVSTGWLLIQPRRSPSSGSASPGCQTRRRGQRLEPRQRRVLGLGHDAGEAAVAHHRHHAWHGLRPGLVERGQRRAGRRRAQHAGMQQAGQGEVVDEARAAEHLVGDVDALRGSSREAPRGGGLGRDRGGGVAVEQALCLCSASSQ